MQVFSASIRLTGKPVYAVEIAANADDLKVAGEGGLLSFLAQRRFAGLKGSFDSLLLVCGVATRNARDAALFAWLRKMAPEVRRIGSACVGAFLFAEAGLLNGRRATAHWKFGEELAKRYPRVRVESNPFWVKDGNIYTSAGISAGIDLALALVEEDCGAAQGVVAEELFYRGYAIERRQELTRSRAIAGIFSGAVFTFAHAATWGWGQLLFAGLAAIILTLLYLWGRNLWVNMITHAVVDGIGVLAA